MNPFLKAMQPKKKRAVDPNAPPRPNLMSHDVKLRDMVKTIEMLEEQVQRMARRIEELERKNTNQTNYLSAVHSALQRRK